MLGPRATDRTSSRGRRRVVTDHFEWVRLVNCALSLTTAAAFYLFAVDTWERHGGGVRLLRLAVAGLLLVGVYGSAEQYVQHARSACAPSCGRSRAWLCWPGCGEHAATSRGTDLTPSLIHPVTRRGVHHAQEAPPWPA